MMEFTRSSSSFKLASLAFAFAFIIVRNATLIQAFQPISELRPVSSSSALDPARSSSCLYAAAANNKEDGETKKQQGGPPQYDKIMASLQNAEVVANGTILLHIQAGKDDTWDYEPGHVLALEIKGSPKDGTTHTYEDTLKNKGWMRGPYTVTASSEKELQILLRIVGEKSQAFADAKPGTQIQVGGKFKVPIVEGIDVATTSQVVLVSTGVGIGPCVGAMEQVVERLTKGKLTFPPIHLMASFRTKEEIALADKLDKWQQDYPTQFSWTPVVTCEKGGRLSSSVERLQDCLKASPTIDALQLQRTHFHLIGNGELVNEFQKGLDQAGVPKEKVTLEVYFNHSVKGKGESVDTIAQAIQGMASEEALAVSGASSFSSSSSSSSSQ